MTMNDQTIIDNTHFKEVDGKLICYTNLPGEDKFAQAVSSREAVQKNMIGWCNTVREYVNAKERDSEREREAAKLRRQAEQADLVASPPERTEAGPPKSPSAKQLVLEHWENLKDRRWKLMKSIAQTTDELAAVDKEMDELSPVIKAWKGVKGES